MVKRFSMNSRESCQYTRTKKWLINVSKSLILKVGRGSEYVNVDGLQVILIYSNKRAQYFPEQVAPGAYSFLKP